MTLLFEYGRWAEITNKESLKEYLQKLWQTSLSANKRSRLSDDERDPKYQPFLKFDGSHVRANNYIGFIQNGDDVIEIYPKVFKNLVAAESRKELMMRHIFYWLSYCRKWRFPFAQAALDNIEINEFPELIINLIANQFLETVSEQPLTTYQPCEETLRTPRGSINFGRYITSSLSRGNFHNLECDHEPFLFDNKVNRIIKHCSRLLLSQTRFHENQRVLQEIIFILDEVEDKSFDYQDAENISLNSFFENYLAVIDSCKMILRQQLYSSSAQDLTQWSLLLPMEYIFEDFLAGFLAQHFKRDWKVEYQKSDLYLSNEPKAFRMQHDIFLTLKSDPARKIIVDTKYKLRDSNFKTDPKKGISQNDLYQMVSYAFKRGCTEILLVYPNISNEQNLPDEFNIISGFRGEEKIRIKALEVPFWTDANLKEFESDLVKILVEIFK